MKNKLTTIFLALILILSATTNIFASSEMKVTLNGEYIEISDTAVIQNDITLLPLRPIVEAMGADIYWYEAEQLVVIVKNEIKLFLVIDDYELIKVIVDDVSELMQIIMLEQYEVIVLESAPTIINNRTHLPIRAIAEALGAEVFFENGTVVIVYPEELLNDVNRDKTFFDDLIEMMYSLDQSVALLEEMVNSLLDSTLEQIDSLEEYAANWLEFLELLAELGLDDLIFDFID
ncbi:MAG: copper amine oxidase N-terminal domain-containing protein [Defluviitaleaceae bacterium]|nr:copper amine oxidase N-terminal domain-containing protein [Defluviitaleaceae bacterium]